MELHHHPLGSHQGEAAASLLLSPAVHRGPIDGQQLVSHLNAVRLGPSPLVVEAGWKPRVLLKEKLKAEENHLGKKLLFIFHHYVLLFFLLWLLSIPWSVLFAHRKSTHPHGEYNKTPGSMAPIMPRASKVKPKGSEPQRNSAATAMAWLFQAAISRHVIPRSYREPNIQGWHGIKKTLQSHVGTLFSRFTIHTKPERFRAPLA